MFSLFCFTSFFFIFWYAFLCEFSFAGYISGSPCSLYLCHIVSFPPIRYEKISEVSAAGKNNGLSFHVASCPLCGSVLLKIDLILFFTVFFFFYFVDIKGSKSQKGGTVHRYLLCSSWQNSSQAIWFDVCGWKYGLETKQLGRSRCLLSLLLFHPLLP